MICLQTEDPAPYRDAVIDACLHNRQYDRQSEGGRIDWLYDLMKLAGVEREVRATIDEALNPKNEWDPTYKEVWDRDQMVGLLGYFARDGDAAAVEYLHSCSTWDEEGSDAVNDAILLGEGFDGLRWLADRYADVFKANSDDPYLWFNLGFWFEDLKESIGEERFTECLNGCTDPNLKLLSGFVKKKETHQPPKPVEPVPLLFAELLELMRKPGTEIERRSRSRGGVLRFRRTAGEEGYVQAAHVLLNEDDPIIFEALARLFNHQPFPLAIEPLITNSVGSTRRAKAYRKSLVGTSDPNIRDLALKLLPEVGEDPEVLDLFRRNYRQGDWDVILKSVQTAKMDDPDKLHRVALAVVDIFEKLDDPSASELLEWVYETTPCSFCRLSVFRLLVKWGTVSNQLLHEASFDADEQTRAMAKEAIRIAQPTS